MESSTILHEDINAQQVKSLTDHPRGVHGLHRWCYSFHVLLCILHLVLLAMLWHHPEHAFTIPFDNSILTTGLSAFLQAFYSVCGPIVLTSQMSKYQPMSALYNLIGPRDPISRIVYFPFSASEAHHYARHISGLGRTRICYPRIVAANEDCGIALRSDTSVLILDVHFCPTRRIVNHHAVPTIQCLAKYGCSIAFNMA